MDESIINPSPILTFLGRLPGTKYGVIAEYIIKLPSIFIILYYTFLNNIIKNLNFYKLLILNELVVVMERLELSTSGL